MSSLIISEHLQQKCNGPRLTNSLALLCLMIHLLKLIIRTEINFVYFDYKCLLNLLRFIVLHKALHFTDDG